jgi:hypothetical protein
LKLKNPVPDILGPWGGIPPKVWLDRVVLHAERLIYFCFQSVSVMGCLSVTDRIARKFYAAIRSED